jgi:hypothetical protein
MKTLKEKLTQLLLLEEAKNTTRDAFREAHFGEDGYEEKQTAFRTADDAYELAAQSFGQLVQELASCDELSDAVDQLHELMRDFVRLSENRGFNHILAENEAGLASIARRWQKAAAKMTAFKRINLFCRDLSVESFEEEMLAGLCPSNIDENAWEFTVEQFNQRLDEFNEQTNYEVEPEKAILEVAFDLEQESRRSYDKLTARFVDILQDMQLSGRLSGELEQLDYTLLPVVRDALTRVPQLQTQTSPALETRSVTVLDRDAE